MLANFSVSRLSSGVSPIIVSSNFANHSSLHNQFAKSLSTFSFVDSSHNYNVQSLKQPLLSNASQLTGHKMATANGHTTSSYMNGTLENYVISKRHFSDYAHGEKVLTGRFMNDKVKNVQYAVRGPIVQKATEYELMLEGKSLHGSGDSLPFDTIIKANIGDCQAMWQKPLTFLRQVLAACMYPELLEINPPLFPEDVLKKANAILNGCPGRSLGSYSDSCGHRYCREIVQGFIEKRDGFPSCVDSIILSNGASEIIKLTLMTATFGEGTDVTGVMIPVPQYPLYSATISEIGAERINYYLDESNLWSLSIKELEKAYKSALDRCVPRVLCVINPGNPTGQVLTRENIDAIIEFAATHKLVLMGDEVYQDNVYDDQSQFHSFKKALLESPHSKTLELVSFHSMSKGFMGECGIRGGYAEYVNFDEHVLSEIKKLKSAQLCSTVSGQVAFAAVLDPPEPGDPSYETFTKEKNAVLGTLKRKSEKVYQLFSSMPGIKVNPIMGAMYCFPQIELPPKALQAAREIGVQPDAYYVEQLLDETGICVVPGSGFGQLPGTWHFRTTILPDEENMDLMLAKFKDFHVKFLERYA